jgi:hypothetical protein
MNKKSEVNRQKFIKMDTFRLDSNILYLLTGVHFKKMRARFDLAAAQEWGAMKLPIWLLSLFS